MVLVVGRTVQMSLGVARDVDAVAVAVADAVGSGSVAGPQLNWSPSCINGRCWGGELWERPGLELMREGRGLPLCCALESADAGWYHPRTVCEHPRGKNMRLVPSFTLRHRGYDRDRQNHFLARLEFMLS